MSYPIESRIWSQKPMTKHLCYNKGNDLNCFPRKRSLPLCSTVFTQYPEVPLNFTTVYVAINVEIRYTSVWQGVIFSVIALFRTNIVHLFGGLFETNLFEEMWKTSWFLVMCALSTILLLVPLAWHAKNKNLSAICLISWIILFNIISFVNAIIWGGDDFADSWNGIGFCDVEIKLIIASASGTMAAAAAISRNLARIMSDSVSVIKTKSIKRREFIQDLLICFTVPTWMVVVHYIVQPNRYYIVSFVGCQPSVDNSWVTVVLLYMWPPIIALIAAYYAGLVLFRVHKYRQQFSEILRNSGSSHTKSRFFRLFLLSMVIVTINLPLSWYVFYRNLRITYVPYSWKLVHGIGWNYITKIPSDGIQFDRWIPIVAGFISFVFFGTGSDATKMYRGWAETTGIDKYLSDSLMGKTTPNTSQWSQSEGSTLSSGVFSKGWVSGKRFLFSTSSPRVTSSTSDNTLVSSNSNSGNPKPPLTDNPESAGTGSLICVRPEIESKYDENGIRVERAIDIVIETGEDQACI